MAEVVVPLHVAIIPDGNRRWARERGLSPMEGHRAGYEQAFAVAEMVANRGVRYMTFYAFSTENWKRAQEEVGFLLSLLERFVTHEAHRFHEKGFRMKFFGSKEGIEERLWRQMKELERRSATNTGATLNLCFNYGGRRDIVEAVQGIVREGLSADVIDEAVISDHLSSKGTPPPDLVVRTSGEQRLSNYLLWEAAYAELMFFDCYWPDFGEQEIEAAFSEYSRRHRRYGQ